MSETYLKLGSAGGVHNLNLPVSRGEEQPNALEWKVLSKIALCIVPAMGIFASGSASTGAKWFFAILLLVLARYSLQKDRFRFTCFVVGVIPALMIFRSFLFYTSTIFILGTAILLWFIIAPNEGSHLFSNVRLRFLFFLAVVYWLLSFYLTGNYAANLRVMECLFAVGCVYLLVNQWRFLATAMLGIVITILSLGFGFLPYGERLGMAQFEEFMVGNAITFGIPLTLVVVLSIADHGRWLLLENYRYWRLALALAAGAFLLLSTSRGSWAVIVVNLIALLFLNKKQRGMLVGFLALCVIAVVILLATSRGEFVEDSLDRTVSSERTLASSTSGRSDQWWLFPEVLEASPLWGFGPGSGEDIYARYSSRYNIYLSGRRQGWHAIYMHIGAETGLIGLGLLLLLLISLVFRGFSHWQRSGDTVPFLGILSYLVIGASVVGMDAASGVYLGLAFLSTNWRPEGFYETQTASAKLSPGDGSVQLPGAAERRPLR